MIGQYQIKIYDVWENIIFWVNAQEPPQYLFSFLEWESFVH